MAAPELRTASSGALDDLPDRVVLFDGVCVVCNRSVDWLLRRDRASRLHFAPLQGETARRIRAALPGRLPEGIDTIAYLERSGGEHELSLRTRALRRILDEAGGGPLATLLRVLPVSVADLGYRAFARQRHRLFGRRDACRVPNASERARFLP